MGSCRLGTVAVLALVGQVTLCWGHVALTFPPARKYDLDFLDHSRTKGPCGMPKGSTSTSLLSGKPFNITWHLAYPHKGGFRLQVLDKLLRPVLDLTPVTAQSEFVAVDSTAQQYMVQIPADFECQNCTIRLLREAKEWAKGYRFWSCADVDIKPRNSYREDCSGHGRYLLSKCRCDRLYWGPRCQYKEECLEDSDCGDMGRCVDIRSTTPPTRHCYCQIGWFGPGCKKRSPVKTTELDLSSHMHQQLGSNFNLYWRLMIEEQELEVILKVNGTSYAGIGWRPATLTPSCKNFPLLEDPPGALTPADSETNSEEPEPESKSNESAKRNNLNNSNHGKEMKGDSMSEHEEKSREPEVSQFEPTSEPEPFNKSVTTGGSEPASEPEPASDPEPASEPEPTSVPEPASEPEPKAEPEPKSKSGPKSESEPNAEPEPTGLSSNTNIVKPSAQFHTVASRETKETSNKDSPGFSVQTTVTYRVSSSQEPSVRQKRDTVDKGEVLGPYTPRHDFNAMDCTDMVIGTARGMTFRIWDYYTRDRSTPRVDTFWGGKNDLTAAMGFEKDGVTTILFRKKLIATEPTDHSIENAMMHIIWARGQEIGNYVHVPMSGLESETASVNDFYRPDELKYHGHKDQRGMTAINFFEQSPLTGQESGLSGMPLLNCRGQWLYPKDCNADEGKCEYVAKWQFDARTDNIHFTISTTNINLWTGIGFSNNRKMAQTDAVIGWIAKSGRPFIMDTWIVGQTAPLIDPSQNIYNVTGSSDEGVTTLTFTRKRNTGDSRDLPFTDDKCLYMIFPVKGGGFHPINKKIAQHQNVQISPTRICLKSCSEGEEPVTAAPTYTNYNAEIRLLNFEKKLGNDHFELLKSSIVTVLKKRLIKISGFHKIDVSEFKQEKSDIVAKLLLELDDEQTKKNLQKGREEDLKKVFEDCIASGKIGSLTVDPGYLIFELMKSSQKPQETEDKNKTALISLTKLWIVIGCIAALIVVAIMQAGCTMCKVKNSASTVHKDNLIQNSAWKDYSAANSNYAFEAFESEEKHPGSLGQTNGSSLSSRPAQKPINSHPMLNYQGNGNRFADTRSLQRPKGYSHPVERSTYSLPRTQPQPPLSYYTHRPQRNSSDQLQPDFYFMPSQRKYSGEVVRVYVDYNNPHK